MNTKSVSMLLPLSLLLLGLLWDTRSHAFLTGFLNECCRHQHRPFWARPTPTDLFDLEEMERLEAKMESESSLDIEDTAVPEDVVHVVPPELHEQRIDAVVASLIPSISRTTSGKLVVNGKVKDENYKTLNRKAFKVPAGTTLRVQLPKGEPPAHIVPQPLPLDILYEDEHMIVINKAAGMVVHPGAGNVNGTLVNALAFYLTTSSHGSGEFDQLQLENVHANPDDSLDPFGADGENVSFQPGIVHRLDKGTTGVIVVAKTKQALATLARSFALRKVKKTYLAVAVGNPGRDVVIDKPIGRHRTNRQMMRVVPAVHQLQLSSSMASSKRGRGVPQGQRAVSRVDTLAFDGKLSLVKVQIETGRTHQIRVHLQDRRTPIYGDTIYGNARWNQRLSKAQVMHRPLLHAYELELDHPVSGNRMFFTAPMPDDMKTLANTIWPEGKNDLPNIFN